MKKLIVSILIFAFLAVFPWILISSISDGKVYRDVELIPYSKVGLLLGTTPSVNGRNNIFFSTRIEAAKTLYERGKISHILVSGDNATEAYNEPEAMRKALIKAGIPEKDITLDYAGFRTLDSVVRAREIFCQEEFTIISQPFHVERALFLSRMRGISARGFGSANISIEIGGKTYIREIGARWIALYDAFVGTDPIALGKKECISSK